ncbi:oxidoreductase family protein [Shewanella woodyi]|uniref:oxidoreductase family protein n=1 Tax=Shewanella woodyi TaxID=60961 RepID=UPI0009ECDE70|nr:oxidoreductase family protein [Shewanella woodyi]
MNTQSEIIEYIQEQFSCSKVIKLEKVQTLWSGYGEISRYQVMVQDGAQNIIVKSIVPPNVPTHPKGWQGDVSHLRKIKSYQVEANWYQDYASTLSRASQVPHCFGVKSFAIDHPRHESSIILLSDLDASGFSVRKQHLSVDESKVCIKWLAIFHANNLQDNHLASWPKGLWATGSYWYLATRQNEYHAMQESDVKSAAYKLDDKLNRCRFKTIIHGDAKVANFCFSADLSEVAAVDFQYVGAGCGMKDLVYFMGSCLSEHDCQESYEELLEYYFSQLSAALQSTLDSCEIIEEWRPLFFVAWADFQRFLLGWSPEHHKINDFSSAMTQRGISLVN